MEYTSSFRDYVIHSLSSISHFVYAFSPGQKPNYLTFNYSPNYAQSLTRLANTRANTYFGECSRTTYTRYNRVCRPLSKGSVLGLIAETRDRHVKKVPEEIASPLPFALRLILSVRITDRCIIAYCDQPNQFFCLKFN